MPDNTSPAAQPERSSEPIEFNFDKPASDIPRIKRRSLKAKNSGLKPAATPPAVRDLEREAPPLSDDKTATPIPTAPAASAPAPSTNGAAATQKPAGSAGASRGAAKQKVTIALTSQQKATAAVLAASTPISPHGTRPATLYYTSQPKKETSDSMKTTPAATPTSSSPGSAPSAARPAQATNGSASASRPAPSANANANAAARPATAAANSTAPARAAATNFDYRANVDRQSREQKSVSSILAYFVYGLLAVFLISAGLATYGSVVIFDKLHDQSTSISSLDDKYSQKVDDLNKRLAATQDSLIQAQAQNARQLDLLNRQEEEINQLRTAINAASSASAEAIHAETRARSQEAASLRARIRDLEYKTSVQQTSSRL